jgi:hypothetical protein
MAQGCLLSRLLRPKSQLAASIPRFGGDRSIVVGRKRILFLRMR